MAYDNRDSIDFGKEPIPKLFGTIFVPTVLGMICTIAFILTDGIFVGHGIGPDGLAGVNLVAPIMMLITGFGMMFGIGGSVVAAIHLARHNDKAARINVTQAFAASFVLSLIVAALLYFFQYPVLRFLGTSTNLMTLTREYYLWFIPTAIFIMIQIVGEFVIRLDGSPKYAMLANMIPAGLNIILDFIFIFPCKMSLLGAALATDIGTAMGAGMTVYYMARKAGKLRFYRLKATLVSLKLSIRNISYMMRVGFSGFLGEFAMSVITVSGNLAFGLYLGDSGIAAFSITCYLLPVVVNIYYSVSSSAQPIISFNYGAANVGRVNGTFHFSLKVGMAFSIMATLICWLLTKQIISIFLTPYVEAYCLAEEGLPLLSTAFLFMAFNASAIGYFQSTEKNLKSTLLMAFKGVILPVAAFSVLPALFGENGLWLAIPCSEAATLVIALLFLQGTPLNTLRRSALSVAVVLIAFLASGCSKPEDNQKNEIKCWDDLAGKKICVCVGSLQEQYIANHCPPGCEVLHFNSFSDEVEALNSGKVDALLGANIHTVMLNIQNPCYHDAVLLDIPMNITVGFQKEDTLHIKEFNRFLAEYKESGEYEAMTRRWTVNFKKEGRLPEMNLPEEGDPIRVAAMLSASPYQHMDKNGPAGVEIEVILRYSEWCGRPVKFSVMDFAAVIPSLVSGKVDMAVATLTATEERAKKIGFSDTMYSSFMSVIVKDEEQEVKHGFLTKLKNSFVNNLVVEDRYKLILEGLKATLIITLSSLLAGSLMGALICAMRMGRRKIAKNIAIGFVNLMRGIPVLVILMILFYVIFASSEISGTTIAIIAFSFYFAAYVSEIYRSALLAIDKGQYEAAYSMGFSKFRTFFTFILPQAVKIIAPVYKGEATSLLKSTSVVGYVAIQDLTKMSDIIRSRTFDAFFPLIVVALIYFILAWIFGKLINMLIRQ